MTTMFDERTDALATTEIYERLAERGHEDGDERAFEDPFLNDLFYASMRALAAGEHAQANVLTSWAFLRGSREIDPNGMARMRYAHEGQWASRLIEAAKIGVPGIVPNVGESGTLRAGR